EFRVLHKTPKKEKKTPTSVKPIHYGPKKQGSKVVHPAEPAEEKRDFL
ncbi:hypothetical protein A2U01_0075225, partial [Trifolium medium]|nr:hypothetical protein [Trifolium medium]